MGKLYPMLHVDQEVRSPAQEPRSGLFLKHLHRLVNGRRLIEKNWGSRIYLPPRADNYRSNRVCLLSWSLASSANPPDPKRFTLTPPGILGNSGNTSSSSGSLKFATRPSRKPRIAFRSRSASESPLFFTTHAQMDSPSTGLAVPTTQASATPGY